MMVLESVEFSINMAPSSSYEDYSVDSSPLLLLLLVDEAGEPTLATKTYIYVHTYPCPGLLVLFLGRALSQEQPCPWHADKAIVTTTKMFPVVVAAACAAEDECIMTLDCAQ
jgi:hypothetical protein